jgi:hypothetical protein
MKHFYAFIFLILIISCKKETLKNTDLPPNTVIHTEEGKILSIDTLLFQNDFDPTVIKFYQANQYKTFWMDFNCRESIISLLNNVEEEGLNSNDFDNEKIITLEIFHLFV